MDEAGLPVEDAKEASGLEDDSSDDDEVLLSTMFVDSQRKDDTHERSESTVSDCKEDASRGSMLAIDEEDATKDSKVEDTTTIRPTSSAPSTVDGTVSPASQMQNLFGNSTKQPLFLN